jgi:hypothetical protein
MSLWQLQSPDGHLLRAGLNLSKSTGMSIKANTSDKSRRSPRAAGDEYLP